MALSADELIQALSVIEPGPRSFERITADDVPLLRELFSAAEPWLAVRIVLVTAAFADRPGARGLILDAARDPRPEARTAAASAAARLSPDISDRVLAPLLGDENIGVRRSAVLAVRAENGQRVKETLARMSAVEQPAVLRADIASQMQALRP